MTTPTSLAAHSDGPIADNISSKPPHVPATKAPTPLTIRLLRDMDEEIWMSGSELKTDNSSSCCSDTEENNDKRLDKMRKRTKRRTHTKSYSDSQSKTDKLSLVTLRLDSTTVENTTSKSTGQLDNTDDTESELAVPTPTWRPKRGSIASLPGLQMDLEKIDKC